MPASFKLTLDTQTSLALEYEAGPEPNTIIVKLAADADVVEAKLWGAIDITDPGNANYSETMGGADWFPFSGELLVKVGPGDGQKVFSVRVRDDVWNESAIETIKFGVAPEEEVGPPSGGVPGRTPAKPKRKRSRDRSRTIEPATSVVGVLTQVDVERDFRLTIERPVRIGVATAAAVERRRLIIGRASSTGVGSRADLAVTQLPDAALTGVISDFKVIKRRGRADDEAIVALLLAS